MFILALLSYIDKHDKK
ncbi:hypothetical protein PT287_04930 [Lactobacillus sp. ESL0679]|nr:hypothetical protein [Lactobacillus sp. ESL0679]MDF7682868.1 hypothetical protein [Lactobacillus sp. ESL0679]